MYLFDYNKNNIAKNSREFFANEVCKLIVNKNNNDLRWSILHVKIFISLFFEHVGNMYECNDIPLFTLHDLIYTDDLDYMFEAENYPLTKKQAIEKTKKACLDFYCA